MSNKTVPNTDPEDPAFQAEVLKVATAAAHTEINLAEVMLYVWALVGFIGGSVLAVHKVVALGIATALAAFVTATFGLAVLAFMRARLAVR